MGVTFNTHLKKVTEIIYNEIIYEYAEWSSPHSLPLTEKCVMQILRFLHPLQMRQIPVVDHRHQHVETALSNSNKNQQTRTWRLCKFSLKI